MPTRKRTRWLLSTLLLAPACAKNAVDPDIPRNEGQTTFVSADGINGAATGRTAAGAGDREAAPAADSAAGNSNTRTVEEGDIYRVASAGRVLNLNNYRGLQILDVSNPSAPSVLGRLPIVGYPVEMYQVGSRVYLLLNNWRGYYGSRADVRPEAYEGGIVVAVDIGDERHPRETGRARVPGWIRTSRLTRGGGQEALYVVSSFENRTKVKSFTVSGAGALEGRSEIDLGGWVSDIQATGDRLLVARSDYGRGTNRGEVAVIDISDPSGSMREGGSVQVGGLVQKKTNMDLRGNVLRVVSANSWGGSGNTNHLETFDASDIMTLTPLDHATFGDGQQLFGTIFLEDRAFFVTYERRDPFHAFSIDANGRVEERSQFIVSGWNDFFRPVANDTRLVGIGKNDQNGQTLAISLYDISDLGNANPLLDRDEMNLQWGWSEASWDDRAFSVLEGATAIAAPNGEMETGLVLLPFSGWDQQTGYHSGTQIFTFSGSTVTKRGVMVHDTPVRRSFALEASAGTAGNLSEEELSLFDVARPDAPAELGRVELAPNYNGAMVYGSHVLRRHTKDHWARYWGGRTATLPNDTVEIVPLAGDVDGASPVATVEIRPGARLFRVGSRLAAVSYEALPAPAPDQPSPGVRTTIDLWDLANPASPAHVGSLETSDIPAFGGYWYGGYEGRGPVADCFDCGWGWGYGWGGTSGVEVVGNALVFVASHQENELEGTVTTRYLSPSDQAWARCWDPQSGHALACTYVSGGVSCETLARVDGTVEPEVCSGSFYECEQDVDGTTSCEAIDQASVSTQESSWTGERRRYWQHFDFRAVDLRGAPALAGSAQMATNEEAVGLLANGTTLNVTYKQPVRVPNDPRPHARYFYRALDWSNPASPTSGPNINVPGELIAVDGSTILTKDTVWGQNIIETAVVKLSVSGGTATLRAVRVFTDRLVEKVQLDGLGHVLVSNGETWQSAFQRAGTSQQPTHKLTILDLGGLSVAGEADIDVWAQLQSAVAGRALFTVPGGVLVVNLDDASDPYAQAYFPVNGWSAEIEVSGRQALFAAGRYGLYKFDLDAFNLLTE